MSEVYKKLKLLGLVVEDKVTGFTGTVVGVSFDLYGCIQGLVQQKRSKGDKAPKDPCWFDVSRLKTVKLNMASGVPVFITDDMVKCVESLGFKAKDKIHGDKGIVSSVMVGISGAVSVSLSLKVDKDGDIVQTYWTPKAGVKITSKERNMPLLNYTIGYVAEGNKGSAEKPSSITTGL